MVAGGSSSLAGSTGAGAASGGGATAGASGASGSAGADSSGGNTPRAGSGGNAAGGSGGSVGEEIVIQPRPSDEAFANPLAGFRPDLGNSNHYATLFRQYIKWNELENSESDGVDKIQAFCDAAWKDLPQKNAKVIPRVYLDWPGSGSYWPSDLTSGDFTSAAFKARLVRLITRLGQVWDKDARVAFIQTGLIGQWGEQHDPAPTGDLAAQMGAAFASAFPHKLLENRYPGAFSQPWGIYWDSFGCDQNAQMHALGSRYASAPYEGEIAYDYCKPAGQSPLDDLSKPENTSKIVNLVRDFHTTALGWIADAPYESETAAGTDALQKAFGYRFVIDEARFPARAHAGSSLGLTLQITNTGSAPFYYRFPLEVSLLDSASHLPVWKGIADSVDVRAWLPGDAWDAAAQRYMTPAPSNQVSISLPLPAELASGEYLVAVTILDPASMLPAVRFAIANYFAGGRHPLGYVGVDVDATHREVDAAQFSSLAADTSLHY